jgi:glutathione S-transferase
LNALGIKYRRIPLLAIGRDVYADSRLILRVLEERFPNSESSNSALINNGKALRPLPHNRLLSELFTAYTVSGGIFVTAVGCMPLNSPMLQNEAFLRDRADMAVVKSWGAPGARRAARPHAVADLKHYFTQLESALDDGRRWIGGGQTLGAEDLDAVWPLEWMVSLPGALDENIFGTALFPCVYAWMERIRKLVKTSQQQMGEPLTVSGEHAVAKIKCASFARNPADTQILERDPLGLKVGDEVLIWPTDSGSLHKDRGRLIGLKEDEVVIEVQGSDGTPIRLHTPRWGFRVVKVVDDEKSRI